MPYDETVFLDSDCLIIKQDMDRHWKLLASQCFNVAGTRITKGSWYNFEVSDVCSALGLEYLVHMNSGVMYFRKGQELEEFQKTVQDLRDNARNVLFVQHRDMNEQIADEPIWSAAMARLDMSPVEYSAEDGWLMVTTYMSRQVQFDPINHLSELEKSEGYHLLDRFISKGWVRHSPSIAHFIMFKPKSVYRECVSKLRDWGNVEPSEI